ncbi:MAG: S-methyl-5-thioribose-1-phosphate isomerase [Ignavibacteriaceae bacterium]|jgi:methylthioribose-1-phosphate isomerase
MNGEYFSIKFQDDKVIFLDQTKLPFEEIYVETDDVSRIAEAIERLEIRGAPLIGITAAYALALSQKNINPQDIRVKFDGAYQRIKRTRPTGVNLFNALDLVRKTYEENKTSIDIYQILLSEAKKIHREDIDKCRKIGQNGSLIFKKKSTVLTHCNTGKLATGGDGTAFSVIKNGFEKGLVEFVYADETRPLLQGSRLTAFELERNGIPFAVQTDSMAAVLMQQCKIDFVITGADRIALNGDSANKVGTYNLAVLCNYHNIPFYIAAPTTTIDRKIAAGEEIEIEFRNKKEILTINGNPITPENYQAFSPSFDVTPSHLISGIITEERVHFFPYNFIQ